MHVYGIDEDFCLRITRSCMPKAGRERAGQREARKKILRPVQALNFPIREDKE
jgi:hypothetical protein